METSYRVPSEEVEHLDLHRMVVMQPGEKIICVINRHPFGIIEEYVGATLAIVIVSILVLVTVPGKAAQSTQDILYTGLAGLVLVLVAVLAAATRVYWENHWIITTDSLTQVTQGSLFGAKVSSLSLDSLEDITVDQSGALARMFNFGTLHAETAGHSSKFRFSFCPNPVEEARKIIDAKEKFLATKAAGN